MNVDESRELECKTLDPAASDPLLGRVIAGRYRVDAALGQSGAGRLYKAMMAPIDRAVALRVLPAGQPGREAGERFAHEASIAGHLTHPNTVRLIDFGRTDEGSPFLAMEYLSGRTLQQALLEGPLGQVRAVHLAQQIGRSLREAHSLEVVHRSLRPACVMLLRQQDEQDFVKVMDYGVPPAHAVSQLALLPAVAAHYLAPEQARSQQPDARTDVYALGALLYEMLTGRPPFIGTTATEVIVRHLAEQPLPPRSLRPELAIDEGLERVVLRCLAKDRAARFASMDELLSHLKLVRARLTNSRVDLETSIPPQPRGAPRGLPTPMDSTPVVNLAARELTAPSLSRLAPVAPASASTLSPNPALANPALTEPLFAGVAESLRPRPWRWVLGGCALLIAGALLANALRGEPPPSKAAAVKAAEPHRATPLSFDK